MKNILLGFTLLLVLKTVAQENIQDTPQKNIFRAGLTIPIGISLYASWEKRLSNSFSITTKGSFFSYFGNKRDPAVNDNLLLAAILDADLRYYFNIKKRMKKGKNIKNFSASYISLNPYTASNPILKGNQTFDYEGNNGIFLNLGVQKQLRLNFYLNAFFGVLLGSRSFKGTYSAAVDPAHIGLSIGYVFSSNLGISNQVL